MNSVNKTLYIPLYGKAYVSRKGYFLKDSKAEEIWAAEGFALKGKARSKWLAYYMGIRSAVFDQWVTRKMEEMPGAVVLHLGCGMDSRVLRVASQGHLWIDVDLPAVMDERRRYFSPSPGYRMLAGDLRQTKWLEDLPENGDAIVVMEGVSMYLTREELQSLMEELGQRFETIALLMDCYSIRAARLSQLRNPVRQVGVTKVYGLDRPLELQRGGFVFDREHSMTPRKFIEELQGAERYIFQTLYAGKFAGKLYRLYEYRK